MPRESLLDFLSYFDRYGSEVAYVERRGYRRARWTYRQLADTARQFARELQARGIARGDRVLLWGEDGAEWVAAFWGCLLRGAVVVPMDRIAAPEFARRVSEQVDAKLLVASGEQARLLPERPALRLENLAETLTIRSRDPLAPPSLGRADTAEIVFTSGTTAEPKGVVISHGNLLANLEPLEGEIRKYLKYEWLVHPLRFLNLLPLSHVFGQFLGLFVPPLLGATVVFQESLNPSDIIRTARQERISVLVTVPRLLESLKEKLERDFEAAGRLDAFQRAFEAAAGEHALKRWWRFRLLHQRFGWKFWAFLSGGAALDPATETFWSRLGFAVIQGYGLTETTSLVSVNHPFRLGKGSIGKVLPGREIKLSPTGEILVRGESIASGYWPAAAGWSASGRQGRELKPVLGEEGWFHTGDLGVLDADGRLYFKGREKNVIVTPAGLNIYPEDLEAALRRQPEVRDCVVIALARRPRSFGAEPCAVLLLLDPGAAPEAVVERANQSLADFQKMRRWFLWPEDDFPRTATHKPRAALIQEVVERTLREPGATAATAGPLAELIARVTGRPPAALAPTARLETDLNLSSLDRVELLSALEDRYQVDLNESRFAAATTVAELEEMLRRPLPQRTELHFPRWAQRWPARWLRLAFYYLLVWPATLLLGYPRIRGRENLRGLKGPLLVVANHTAVVDVGFVLAALPARFRHRLAVSAQAEQLEALRRPPPERAFLGGCLDRLGYWLAVALFNVFPLPRQSGFRESFLFAGESVDRGYSVLVFPEGEFTPDGRLMPFRAGIGLLANNLNVPVLLVRLEGVFELKQAGRWWAPPGAVRVSLGAPVRFSPETDPAAIARELEARVGALHAPR